MIFVLTPGFVSVIAQGRSGEMRSVYRQLSPPCLLRSTAALPRALKTIFFLAPATA